MAINRLSIIKALELAIAIICFGLHYRTYTSYYNTDTLSAAAFGGYIIILVAWFYGYFTTNPINLRLDMFYSLVGAIAFVAVGVLNILYYQDKWSSDTRFMGLLKGSLAIINGIFFLMDSLLYWRGAI